METMVKTPIEMPDVERLEPIHTKGLQRVFAVLRLAMGWTFLWAFLDKAFALGFSTGRVVDDAGATVRIASIGGIIWMVIFFTATAIWPEHNPVVDEHVVNAVVLVALLLANAGRYYGLGKIWQRTKLVRRYRVLA